jgi:hypothetical protein
MNHLGYLHFSLIYTSFFLCTEGRYSDSKHDAFDISMYELIILEKKGDINNNRIWFNYVSRILFSCFPSYFVAICTGDSEPAAIASSF